MNTLYLEGKVKLCIPAKAHFLCKTNPYSNTEAEIWISAHRRKTAKKDNGYPFFFRLYNFRLLAD